MFLNIMIKHNPQKKIEKKIIHFLFILWWLGIYLHEENTCHGHIQKNANIFQKWLKWFLIFMKFIVVISRHFT